MSVAEKKKKSGALGETIRVIVQALLLGGGHPHRVLSSPSPFRRARCGRRCSKATICSFPNLPTAIRNIRCRSRRTCFGPHLVGGAEARRRRRFPFPAATRQLDYIKRVIGLPGDRIQMRDGQLFINGEAVRARLPAISDNRE